MIICETCGNEIKTLKNICPFCGNELTKRGSKISKVEIVNLENGMPTVEEAERKLKKSITSLFKMGVNVIKIIHGYGSSGTGGKIKSEIRKSLNKNGSPVKFVIFGEDFTDRDPETKKLIQKYPGIVEDSDFKRRNKGITIIAK